MIERPDADAGICEILMIILLALKQPFADFQPCFKNALNKLAQDPTLDPQLALEPPNRRNILCPRAPWLPSAKKNVLYMYKVGRVTGG